MALLHDSLHRFETRQSDDSVKRDLELTCVECDEAVCDVEPGDTLEALARTADQHVCRAETQEPTDG